MTESQHVVVDHDYLEQLEGLLDKGSLKDFKKILQIFTNYFNEKELVSSK